MAMSVLTTFANLIRQPAAFGRWRSVNRMASFTRVAAGTILTLAGHAHAQLPDTARGQALYENHCQVCHSSKVHARVNRLPVARAEVRDIVEKWQAQQKLSWSSNEVDDVVAYLNQTWYRFKR